MHTKRPWLSLTIGNVAALAVTAVSAAGLGGGASSAVLGRPLDFAVQVRLDPGERLEAGCVSAAVTSGDRRLAAGLVGTKVEMTGRDTARVRVLTVPSIDEPVVEVDVEVGCTVRMSRRYVLFADPPQLASTPAHAATPTAVLDSGLAAGAGNPQVAAAPAAAPSPAPAPEAAAVRTSGPPPVSAPRAAGSAPLATPSADTGKRVSPPLSRERQMQRRAERRAAARAASNRAPAQAKPVASKAAPPREAARLQLDFIEPPRSAQAAVVEEALAAVAQAASAARAAASAASASAERIASLERMVEQLGGEARANRELAAQLQLRLAQADDSNGWVIPLMVATGLLAVLSAWLAWKLGRVQATRQQGWRDATGLASPTTMANPGLQATAPVPFVTSEFKTAARAVVAPAQSRSRTNPAWPPPAPPVAWPPPNSTLAPEDATTQPPSEPEPERESATDPAMQRTQPLPPGATNDAGPARDVSIEELIDLEQQADFFIVLGQDGAAIDLLVEHLRSSGGGSPLPYLKLLEIHHRRDEPEQYEQIRARFNKRFNAYAPEWGCDLGEGRSLEDYPEAIPQLQAVWARPMDAMAELEALLFRKSRGELFDLPAYHEVLFLYSLARDLLDRSAGDTGDVDLLLPVSMGVEFSSTAPSPYLGLQRNAFRDTMPPDDIDSAPIDLDLTSGERPTSIFDLLEDLPPPPPGPRRT